MNKYLQKLKSLSEKDTIVLKNVIGAFLVKGGALFVSLYTLPSYLRFFNNDEVLGLWFTLLSLLNWILNFDLGIGNGLRNHLSVSLSSGDREATKRYTSSAYFSIGAIVAVACLISPLVLSFADLNALLSIPEEQIGKNALFTAVLIVFIGVMLQFWLKLINSVLYAMQKSSINNFLVLCTNTAILLCARFLPSGSNEQNIIVMAVVHALAVALPLLLASAVVFLGKLRYAIPSPRYVSSTHTKNVLSLGGIFFLVQLAYMAIMSTNEYLITKTAGNAYVVEYQAYYKIFSIGSTVFALAMTPIWSAITKAKTEKDYGWIKRTYKRLLLLAALFCAGEILLVLLMKPLMQIWLKEDMPQNVSLVGGAIFSLLGCLMILNSVFSSFSNGTGALKVQAVCFLIGAVLKIPLSFLLVNTLHSWYGVVLANVISMGIYCIAQPFFMKKLYTPE